MADFVIADVTDSMLDGAACIGLITHLCPNPLFAFCMLGYIAGFPNTYAEKVGKTSDALYKGPHNVCKRSSGNCFFLVFCSLFLGIHEQYNMCSRPLVLH